MQKTDNSRKIFLIIIYLTKSKKNNNTYIAYSFFIQTLQEGLNRV